MKRAVLSSSSGCIFNALSNLANSGCQISIIVDENRCTIVLRDSSGIERIGKGKEFGEAWAKVLPGFTGYAKCPGLQILG
jgi:hypothetical protein